MKNNEYTGTMSNVLQSDIDCDTLLTSTNTLLISVNMEGNDDCYGRVAHGQGRGSDYQIHPSLYQAEMPKRGIKSRQNWWALANQARGFEGIRGSTIPPTGGQKIKPARCRLWTTKKSLMTNWLDLTASAKLVRAGPNSIPIPSIYRTPKGCQWLLMSKLYKVWVDDR